MKRFHRIIWLLVLAAHLPALASALVALGNGGNPVVVGARVAALALSCLLFLLKVADSPVVRWRSGRQSLLSLAIIVALLHADVLRRRTVETQDIDTSAYPVAFLVGGLTLLLPALRSRFGIVRSASAVAFRQLELPAFVRFVADATSKLKTLLLFESARPNRAPPALAS